MHKNTQKFIHFMIGLLLCAALAVVCVSGSDLAALARTGPPCTGSCGNPPLPPSTPTPSTTFDPLGSICSGSSDSSGSCTSGNAPVVSLIHTAVNILLFTTGVASVVMILYGAFQYSSSGGDIGAVGRAKQTILSAIIGLVISVSAFAIVQFVVGLFP